MSAIGQRPENRRLGDFEIVREIGRGGMGVVYEARQVSLNRKVALKVLSGGLGLTPKAVQRFRREAEAAAKLHHTNIVPVYSTGEEDGTHFYAMELIEGPSLDHVIKQLNQSRERKRPVEDSTPVAPAPGSEGESARSPNLEATGPYVGESSTTSALTSSSLSSDSNYFDTVARMIAEVADALDYAHKNGVVHRDMKPSNLLLSPAGRLSVNDFGLAGMLEQPGMTMTGEFVGTPAYMSPEQITAGRAPLNHRTDIYSLGATMYELLTLQRPFLGERRDEVIAQIMHKEPKSPRRINRKVPVDLETICLKCLEKDPDRRYQTAGAMAEDLRRYVNRFAISARRAGPAQRLVKWVKRRPAVAASLGCVLVAVCLMLGFAYQAHRAKQQRVEDEKRHRQELLDERIRNAYLIATSGDLDKTEEAIKKIEVLGGSPGQVRLFRGLVYYFRGEIEPAITEFEQAVKLLPNSVAARALLAITVSIDGQFERGDQLVREMKRLSPASPEDYLFKGHAMWIDGLETLNEGIRQRPDSPLGRALRAHALTDRMQVTRDPKDCDRAIEDIDAAMAMLPDNLFILQESILSRSIAAGIYQEAKLPGKRATVLDGAARDVRRLEPFLKTTPTAFWAPWDYYEEIDDRENASNVARRALDRSGSPRAAVYAAIDLYLLGRFEEALQCLERSRKYTPLVGIMRCFALAEREPDGPLLALRECEKITHTWGKDGDSTDVLLFLGKKDRALAILQQLAEPQDSVSKDLREIFGPRYKLVRGELSEEAFLAKAGASPIKKTGAHYHVGLSCLAMGDRDSAQDHFSKAVGSSITWTFEYFWSRMFLSRMEKNKDWPRWITEKKDQPKP
jgi:serine/threonine protein kinase